MKAYNSVLLTIMTACIAFLVYAEYKNKSEGTPVIVTNSSIPITVNGDGIPVMVNNQKDNNPFPTSLDVRVVDIAKTMNVNLTSVGGDTLSSVGGQIVLPVGVHNTVDVDIKGVNGNTMRSSIMSAGGGQSGIPVIVLNK
jgi:hypothetical protein